jgi:hypothetical protein
MDPAAAAATTARAGVAVLLTGRAEEAHIPPAAATAVAGIANQ